MSLIILGNAVCSPNSVASDTTWVDAKRACSISITGVGHVLVIHLFKWLSSLMLLCLEIVHILLASIALSDVLHKVSIVHCVSHLGLVLSTTFAWILRISKSTYSCLIEHLFLVHLTLTIYMREHFVNSWVVSWL